MKEIMIMKKYKSASDKFNNRLFSLLVPINSIKISNDILNNPDLDIMFMGRSEFEIVEVNYSCFEMMCILERNGSFQIIKDSDILQILLTIDEYIVEIRDFILEGNSLAIDTMQRLLPFRKKIFNAYVKDVKTKKYTEEKLRNQISDIFDIFQKYNSYNPSTSQDIFHKIRHPPLTREHLNIVNIDEEKIQNVMDSTEFRHKPASDILEFLK